ncbi:predicted protein [Plenodomus lingam JN3]|uniref:Predicted protein n=1 Tax=Leptosphaeria maculans (strain JN3 / isolate v23.1.3 / race Av1-4-5-6-7-8) TaxID=985895 RepID=E5AAA3_LEPMJ|nr:predicted protein [Plenodomus lingam JN3]CBY00594.1 predicted protein [Plenodomus lingam JN3]
MVHCQLYGDFAPTEDTDHPEETRNEKTVATHAAWGSNGMDGGGAHAASFHLRLSLWPRQGDWHIVFSSEARQSKLEV